MKTSRRSNRMEKRGNRRGQIASLNMVSLMDIFTILVFFLLVNASSVEVLPSAKALTLPESEANTKARENIVVMVTNDEILVQGKRIMSIAQTQGLDQKYLIQLKIALEKQPEFLLKSGDTLTQTRGEVTVMADATLSYSLLKKIMATCTEARYNKVSLAVLQRMHPTKATTGS